jgi:hypothetical protein
MKVNNNFLISFLKAKGACVVATPITPVLVSSENEPEIFNLNFDISPPMSVIRSLEEISRITITNYTEKFTFSIFKNPSMELSYIIDMNYSSKFDAGLSLILELILTPALERIDSFYFTKTKFSVNLPAFYQLDTSDKNSVESSANATKQGAEAAQTLMIIQNVINAGSAFAMKSLMLMEIIRFLRFIDIK